LKHIADELNHQAKENELADERLLIRLEKASAVVQKELRALISIQAAKEDSNSRDLYIWRER